MQHVSPSKVYICHVWCHLSSLHDKRFAFGFHVIKFPNTYSNTYTPQAQTTFYTEIVRLYRINTHSHLFLQNAMELATFCILHNGFDPLNLFVQFVMFVHQIRHHNHLLPASVLVTSLIPQMLTFLLQHVPQWLAYLLYWPFYNVYACR